MKTKVVERTNPVNYFAIVPHDPGSAYGVSFPDVPDCFAAADEPGDILTNAIAALDDYFADGHTAPEPRDIEAIRAELADDLAAGAYLIAVPHIARLSVSERINVSLARGLLRAIDAAVELTGTKHRSAFLAMAARKEIEQRHHAG